VYSIHDRFGGDPTCGFFAIFDGHGGKQVSEHCAERVAEVRLLNLKDKGNEERGYQADR